MKFKEVCIILAAGASSRMGINKMLLPWKHSTILGTVISNAVDAELEPIVVLGCNAQEIAHAILPCMPNPEHIIINENWQEGMVTSIQAGIRYAGLADYWFLHGDMPLLTGAMLKEITARLRDANLNTNDVMFPVCDGQFGHPVWIKHTLRDAILALPPGERLSPFLKKQHWGSAEVHYTEITVDIDTQDVYSNYQ